MRCVICGNELNGCLCPRCGFDLSQHRERYPTLSDDGRTYESVWAAHNRLFESLLRQQPGPADAPTTSTADVTLLAPTPGREPVPSPEQTRKRKKMLWLIPVAALLVLGLLVGAGFAVFGGRSTKPEGESLAQTAHAGSEPEKDTTSPGPTESAGTVGNVTVGTEADIAATEPESDSGKSQIFKPIESEPYVSKLSGNGSYVRADDDLIYRSVLGQFVELEEQARNADTCDERLLRFAQAEAALLDSAALIPTKSQGAAFTISRVAPHTTPFCSWGSNGSRLSGLIVSDDLLTRSEHDALQAQWEAAAAGNGDYDPAAYLIRKGHSLQTSYTATFNLAPNTLDWLDTYSTSAATQIFVNCTEGLFYYDNLGNLQPGLAESYEISDSGRTYRFHIRQGVKWYTSSGDEYAELTAHDFVAGLQHMLDCRTSFEYLAGSGYAEIVGVGDYLYQGASFSAVGCRAEDDYTLVLSLNKPAPYLPSILTQNTFYPICDSFYRAHGGVYGLDEYDRAASQASYTFGKSEDVSSQVYCGPFLLRKLKEDSEILCVKNPNYYNADRVTLDSLRWIYNSGEDPLETYNKTVSGVYTNITLGAGDLLDQARGDGSFDDYAWLSDTNSICYYGFLNLNRGTFALESGACASGKTEQEKADTATALNNKNFRKALQHAFDKASFYAVIREEQLATANLRNMISYPLIGKLESSITDADGYTFPAGTFYGELVQHYCDQLGCRVDVQDGIDGWYKPAAARDYLEAAKTELEGSVSWPIRIDVVYIGSNDAATAQAQAYKTSIEGALGAGNVEVSLIEASESTDYYSCSFYAASGEAVNYDMFYGPGWSADYGDPADYLDIFYYDAGGDMLNYFGLY